MPAKLLAEFFGTFWLVLGGCGSAVLAAAFPEFGIGFTGVSFAFALSVLTAAYALGPVVAVMRAKGMKYHHLHHGTKEKHR